MNIGETCGCGAAFHVKADAGDAMAAVMSWRATHRHDDAAEVAVEEEAE